MPTIEILCTAKEKDETSEVENSITFNVYHDNDDKNDKILSATVDTNVRNLQDGSTSNSSMTLPFDEIVKENNHLGGEDSYIKEDGTILVSVTELGSVLQDALNINIIDETAKYSCDVQMD